VSTASKVARFFRSPKGLLLILLTALTMLASVAEGVATVTPAVGVAVITAAVLDAAMLRIRHRRWEVPSGAMLTGLIIAMVLAPQEPWYVFACTAAIAVASKYAFRTRLANVFNPAAFAIVATSHLFDTSQNWWGALPDLPLPALVVLFAAGLFIADRINKMPHVLAFLGVYYALFTVAAFAAEPRLVEEVFRAPELHTAIYFAFFILTDPPTSPVRYRDQVLNGVIVAVASFAVFELAGAVYYLLAGVLIGNVFETLRRLRLAAKAHKVSRERT